MKQPIHDTGQALFSGELSVEVVAYCIANQIETRNFRRRPNTMIGPLIYRAGADGIAVLFRFGVVVCFKLKPGEERQVFKDLEAYVSGPLTEKFTESIRIVFSQDDSFVNSIQGDAIYLKALTLHHLQIIANVLALSVALERFESRISIALDAVEPIAHSIQAGSFGRKITKKLIHYLGETLLNRQVMLAKFEISDKPELLWEHPEHERFYAQLMDEFEIRTRHFLLEQKLDLIANVASMAHNMIQERRALRVEWYITILILFEIFLSLYGMIFS